MEGMPSSISYTNNSTQPIQESSSSKLPTDRRRIESGGILSPSQTLDQYHQFNVHQQQQSQRQEGRQPYPDPDPDLAQLATAAAATAGAPNSNQPPPQPQTEANTATSIIRRYRECLKNHAASMGGHIVDGCGEFMPSGDEGTAESLKCAACECHRNFHRREIEGQEAQQLVTNFYYSHNPNENNSIRRSPNHHIQPLPPHHPLQHHYQFSHHYSHSLASPTAGPMMMNFGGGGRGTAESSSEDLNMFQSSAGGAQQHMAVPPTSSSASKKRFRTKFTKEQKDRMHEVAEKLGWKIQKQDDEQVQQLCDELGVKRQVFKVWMHNNKQTMKKKQDT